MSDEWFNTVRKGGKAIYSKGLKEALLEWSKEQDIGHMTEIHDILKVIKPKYKQSYLEHLKATSSVEKPRKGAFTGPAGIHTKAKFDGRALGMRRRIYSILIQNGWVRNGGVYVKIHDRKGKVAK